MEIFGIADQGFEGLLDAGFDPLFEEFSGESHPPNSTGRSDSRDELRG